MDPSNQKASEWRCLTSAMSLESGIGIRVCVKRTQIRRCINRYRSHSLTVTTADVYGDSEDLLGRWFAANPGKRDSIFLATKFANKVMPGGGRQIDSSPEYCKAANAKSLKRLGLPYVDLYYCHRMDTVTPIEKTVQAMKELQDEGKVKYLGLSECSAETLRRACKVVHIDCVQVEYSPWALEIESKQIDLLRTCRELGVAVVAYSPIGRGMLSGTLKSPDDFAKEDFRRYSPRFSVENFPKNLKLVDEIVNIAKDKGCTPTQLTLAWLLAQGNDIIPIPGTTKIERLEENLASLNIQLSKEEEQRIRKICEEAEISGGRYPGSFSRLYADTPSL